MTSGRPKRLIWLSGLLYLLLATTMFSIYAVSEFQGRESKLESFCRETKAGDPLAEVAARATNAGLMARKRKATGPLGPAVSVWAESLFLPAGSFCSVHHDGRMVTQVSYNPWYH